MGHRNAVQGITSLSCTCPDGLLSFPCPTHSSQTSRMRRGFILTLINSGRFLHGSTNGNPLESVFMTSLSQTNCIRQVLRTPGSCTEAEPQQENIRAQGLSHCELAMRRLWGRSNSHCTAGVRVADGSGGLACGRLGVCGGRRVSGKGLTLCERSCCSR